MMQRTATQKAEQRRGDSSDDGRFGQWRVSRRMSMSSASERCGQVSSCVYVASCYDVRQMSTWLKATLWMAFGCEDVIGNISGKKTRKKDKYYTLEQLELVSCG